MSNSNFHVCVVEDDDWYRKLLQHTISLNPDNTVSTFSSGKGLLDVLTKESPDLITIDYRLPDMSGEDLIKKIRSINDQIILVVISEQGDIETAVNLLKIGAFDYFTKTKDIRERLHNLISHLRKNRNLKDQVDTLQGEVEQKYEFSNTLIGQSQELKSVFRLIQKASTNNISVMINGETGTGKEMVAKAIHYNSIFKKGPFVPINMGALPKDLVESELFGFEKGAFTGADKSKPGKFEMANEGTLFLDEISELDLQLQAKLLRVLQEREVVRLGSNASIPFKCRILTATNQNLSEKVKKGEFREDLYYRLFGLQIQLPPLRERGTDVLLLSEKFIRDFCAENEIPAKKLSKEAKNKLMGYDYPGNVRELKSIVELAVVMSDSEVIEPDDISFSQLDPVSDVLSEELTLKQYQEKIIYTFLKKYDNDIQKVARRLDIGKSTIYRLLKEKE